ncbi:MAG: molybdopterin dinucleotide binding domain-containing protein, partial [Candidatus Bathyarchaeia archaeon]
DGTFTNTCRRIQKLNAALKPPGEAKPDWQIIMELSQLMGYKESYSSTSDIMEEISKVTPIYGGVHHSRLKGQGIQWPCPNDSHPGTPFLHKDRFTRGKGLFTPVEYKPPAETPNEEYPFILTTGRLLEQFHTGTMTRKSPGIESLAPECVVEINPEDAQNLGIRNGDKVTVTSRRGKLTASAEVTERSPKGMVFIPFHFSEAAANLLTNDALDPISKIPEFKVAAVKVEKAKTN